MIIGNWIIDDDWKQDKYRVKTTYYSKFFDTIDHKYLRLSPHKITSWKPSIFFRNDNNLITFSDDLDSFETSYIQMFGNNFQMNSTIEAQERVDLFLLKLSKLKVFL